MKFKINKSDSSEVFDLYLEKMLKTAGKGDVILDVGESAMKALMGAGEEVAETGAKVAPEVAETGAKVAPEAAGAGADVAKGVARVTSEQLVEAGRKARGLADELDEMSKAAEAVAEGRQVPKRYAGWDKKRFFDELGKARTKLKGAKDQVKALKETGELTARELQQAELIIAKSQAELVEANAAIAKLESELLGAQKDVARITGELTGAEKLTAKLEEQLGQLTARNQELVEQHAKMAEELGGMKALMKAAEDAGQAGELEYKVVAETAETAGKALDDSTKTVQQVAPAIKDDIIKATKEIVAESEKKMAKQLDKAVQATKSGGKGSTSVWSEFAKAAGKPAGAALGKVLVTGASLALLLGLTGGAIWYFVGQNETLREEGMRLTDELLAAIIDATEKVRPLNFKADSTGEDYKDGLLDSLMDARPVVPEIREYLVPEMREYPGSERIKEIGAILDELYTDTTSFLNNRVSLQGELASPQGYEAAIASLQTLEARLVEFKDFNYRATKAWEQQGGETGFPSPPGPAAEEAGEDAGESPDAYKQTVYGVELNLSHLGPQLRSSAPRVISKIMNHPVGMAFSDPHNRWGGGYLNNTGDPRVDYLQDIKFIALNGISSPGELRRFMRGKMSRDSRRRKTGWRDAIKYYRDNRNKVMRGKSAKKSANKQRSNEFSINSEGILMKKKADSFSDSYYQDAVKGLAEQYAKSYYAGLKGMYQGYFGNTDEADFDKLYMTQDETGAELIGRTHPQSTYVADSMGRGGLVENGLEQQRHNVEVALSAPSGNFRSRHAWLIESLVKLAHKADDEGHFEASDLIDKTIEKIDKLT